MKGLLLSFLDDKPVYYMGGFIQVFTLSHAVPTLYRPLSLNGHCQVTSQFQGTFDGKIRICIQFFSGMVELILTNNRFLRVLQSCQKLPFCWMLPSVLRGVVINQFSKLVPKKGRHLRKQKFYADFRSVFDRAMIGSASY